MIALVLVAVALTVLERQARIGRARGRRPHLGTDLAWLGTYLLVGAAVSSLPLGVTIASWAAVPFAVQTVAALVALDLGNYVAHWLLHRVDVLWALHEVHHSSRQLDWLSTFRSHVGEQLLRRVLAPALLVAAGVPAPAVAVAAIVFLAWAMLNHADLRVPLGALEGVLITPRLHRLHHVPATTERNLGTVLACWDRLRGTLVRDAAPADAPLGLPQRRDTYPQDWPAQLVAPLSSFRRTSPGTPSTPAPRPA